MTAQRDPAIRRTVQAEQDLKHLLLDHAEVGVPELVLVAVLRDYADLVEEHGYVPRTWHDSGNIGSTEAAEIL